MFQVADARLPALLDRCQDAEPDGMTKRLEDVGLGPGLSHGTSRAFDIPFSEYLPGRRRRQ
jgi:hypothetical protein